MNRLKDIFLFMKKLLSNLNWSPSNAYLKKAFFYFFLALFCMSALTFVYQFGKIQDFSIAKKADIFSESNFKKIEQDLQKSLKKFKGQWFWQVSLEGIFETVKAHEQIERVRVKRLFLNRIAIYLDSGNAVLNYLRSDGSLQAVLLSGLFENSKFYNKNKDLPILRGSVFLKNKGLRLKAISFLNRLKNKGFFSQKNVSEIYYQAKEKSFYFIMNTGHKIKLGTDPSQLEVTHVDHVLNYLYQKDFKAGLIDARFAQKIVVKF